MKIAISAKGQTPDAELDSRFGRCAYFIVFDSETGSYIAIENTAANAAGGAGSAAAKILNQHDVTVIVSGNYGPHAVPALQAFGITMYLATEERIWMVYDKFKNNLLPEADKATVAGKH